eukprot:TRINITY_DN210_c0_g1_i2.p1 TRINITY_DN210_c0_g1~~TRINITY_DN210_c0_g1_i2.p1  ORF type:complete len:178 (-),score=32.30 TRINITY_DN210_c0_g1_i2:221-676(-)
MEDEDIFDTSTTTSIPDSIPATPSLHFLRDGWKYVEAYGWHVLMACFLIWYFYKKLKRWWDYRHINDPQVLARLEAERRLIRERQQEAWNARAPQEYKQQEQEAKEKSILRQRSHADKAARLEQIWGSSGGGGGTYRPSPKDRYQNMDGGC